VAKPVSDAERQQIIEAIRSGLSCRQVAKQFGRSTDTISRIARDIGWDFGQTNVQRAHEINARYGAEWRADMRQKLAEESMRLLEDMRKPSLVYNFGGKENSYNEHLLDEPDGLTKRSLMQSVSTALQTILRFDAADKTSGNRGLLDVWFAEIDKGADEYRDPAAEGETGVVDRDQ